MAEETKLEKISQANKVAPMLLKLLLGFVFLILGVWAIIVWRRDLISVLKGCIGLFLVLVGFVTLSIAKD